MLPNLPRDELLEFCRKMVLIRHFEESLVGLFQQGHFRGHYHVYIGQEATGVPALSCLSEGDYCFTTHRNHGHLLARGAEPKRLFAEILGRRDGYNKGKGGSFHGTAPSLGFLHTSAVVAGSLPLATGTAYAAKALSNGRVTACLFGDGALEEGAVVEAFNLASLHRLPVLFLCENNGKRGGTSAGGPGSMAAVPLTDIPKAYKIPAQQVDGVDADAVYETVSQAMRKIRAGEGPQFIEAQTVRWPGSEGNRPVLQMPTRIELAWEVESVPASIRDWYRDCDPVLVYIRNLVDGGRATREEIAKIDTDVRAVISEAVTFALASPLPESAEALKDIFA